MSGKRNGALAKRGSLAAMRNAGAYSLSLARSFIQPVPPVVRLRDSTLDTLLPRADYGRVFGAALQRTSKKVY